LINYKMQDWFAWCRALVTLSKNAVPPKGQGGLIEPPAKGRMSLANPNQFAGAALLLLSAVSV
jgi:hypothetical protein